MSGVLDSETAAGHLAALRQNAQEVGLLRKAKGTLAPTARARAVADRPRELVASVLERLPLGKGFEAQAGWFLFLGLAAGESGQTLDTGMAQMLTDLGWSTHSSSGLSASDARRGARSTFDALESMAGGHRATDPRSSPDWPEPPCWASPTPCESADPCRQPPGRHEGVRRSAEASHWANLPLSAA